MASGTGKIWVGTMNGLGAYDPGSGRYLSLNPDLFNWGRTLNVIPALYEQNDSTLWIGTASSLLKCDPRDMSTSKASTLSVVKTICPISECTFFLGTDKV